jgi:hypothetical protein
MTETRTLTAVFADAPTAERAIERLRAAGVPAPSIESHGADSETGDADEPAGGVFAGVSDFLMPAPQHAAAAERPTVVTARDLPEALAERAFEILEEKAVDLHEERHSAPDAEEGAIGTAGGSGRATGEIDRLTGEPVGAPHATDPDGTAPRHGDT